jgi:hypothetical protein
VKDSEGVERKLTPVQPRKIETVFGTVTLERAGYGLKGTESLHPLDAELNLPDERYSLELRRRIAIEAAKSSFLALGTPVTWCPPHSPGRAVFPHPVLRLYSLSRELMPYANTLC